MKPREFWINECTGGASSAEESISNGYHTHVIEIDAYESTQAELEKYKQLAERLKNTLQGYADGHPMYKGTSKPAQIAIETYDAVTKGIGNEQT